MDDRRVHTEECDFEGLDSEGSDFYRKQLQFYQDSDVEEECDSEKAVDHNNFKGIYVDEEPGQKFQDPETGAHFDYNAMYDKLFEVEVELRRSQERDKGTLEK